MLRPLLGVALATFAFASSTPDVQANGDPASDVLISDTIYLSYDKPSPKVADDLRGSSTKRAPPASRSEWR